MRRFLRDAVIALFVGAALIALTQVINAPSDTESGPVQETPTR